MNTIFTTTDDIDIIDKMPIGIFILRRDLVVVSWNLILEQWTGLRKIDIVNKDITLFYPHIKQPKYLDRIRYIFDGGPPMVFSALFHKHFLPCPLPNGNLRIQHTTVVPARTRGDEILAAIAIEDVTELTTRIQDVRNLHKNALLEIEERKKIEKALRKSQEEREKLIVELRDALSKIRTLSGLLPICSSCKKIRNDEGYWEQIETYIRNRSEAEFSHGICPECLKKLYPEFCREE